MDRRIRSALSLLFAVPATALAFDSVDLIPYPSTGTFPAYPADDERPFSAFVQFGVEYDSNPFRLSSTLDPTSDTVMRYGAGARYAGRIVGRQRALVEARADYYDYTDDNVLDHPTYGLLGEWQWELGNSLSGALGAGHTFRIADPGDVQRRTRQDVTTDRAYVNGGWMFATNWRLRAAAEGDKSKRETEGAAGTFHADSVGGRVGLDYVTPLGNSFGLEFRYAEGDAPVSELVDPTGQFVGNDFVEREVAAVVSYGATSQIRVGGRLGYTTRDYTVLPDRDFKGTTWRALIEWLPGNKTILGLETYNVPESIIDVDASHVIRKGSAFTASWAPTVKWVLSGRIFEERRQAIGTPESILLGTPTRDETLVGFRVGLGWEPMRYTDVGVGYEQGKRTSNVLLRDFDYALVSANLRIRF